jgi:hypothetical protein
MNNINFQPPKGRIARFVIWICSKFVKQEIEQIVAGLLEVLSGRNPEVKPKDDFKEKHPNYRNFYVDPLPPLKAVPEEKPKLDYKELLEKFEKENGHPLKPVNKRKEVVVLDCRCPRCDAPPEYMYWNDGEKRTQQKCKVCNELFQVKKNFANPDLRYTVVHIAD